MSSARSFLRVGLKLAQMKHFTNNHIFGWGGGVFTVALRLPSVFSYEFHQILLGVRLSWDGDGLLHEGLIEIHFV